MSKLLKNIQIISFVVAVIGLIAVNSSDAFAKDDKKAEEFISKLGSDAISLLSDKSLSKSAKKTKFTKILDSKFNISTIGRFALGKYWKKATDAEKIEYQKSFRSMIINTYTDRLSEYNDQEFRITGSNVKTKRDSLVRSEIVQDNGPNLRIDWRVRNKAGKLQVIDVIVEDISMSVTQRSDFASTIQRGGGKVSAVIKSLKELNSK